MRQPVGAPTSVTTAIPLASVKAVTTASSGSGGAGATAPTMSTPTNTMRRQAQLHRLHTEQAYDDYEAEFGINIIEASARNLARLRSTLGELSPEEKQLAEFFISHLTAKHKTFDFEEIQKTGALVSVRERERAETKVKYRHVPRRAGDDNIFFTVGIGSHDTPSFLNGQTGGHTIELRLKGLLEEYEPILNGSFVSGHITDYQIQTISRPCYMGETFFQMAHHWKSKTKTYTYQYSDGRKLVRTISMADEIFCGRDLLEGLALQFIEQCRTLGEVYHKHITSTVIDASKSLEQKIEVVSVAMRCVMPGWIYPELKIPGKLALDLKSTHLIVHDESKPVVKKVEMEGDKAKELRIVIKDALSRSDLALLKKLIDRGLFSVKHSLFELIDKPTFNNRKATADFLVSEGADITALDYTGLEAIAKAAVEVDMGMLDILLSIRSPDPRDPFIVHAANVNHSGGFSGDRDLLEELCFLGYYAVLEKLLKAGMVIKNSAIALAYSAYASSSTRYKSTRFFVPSPGESEITYQEQTSVASFATLVKHGADVTEKLVHGKTPPDSLC